MSSYSRKRKRTTRFGPYKRRRTTRRISVVASSGLAPARTGGFYGVAARIRRNEKKVIDVDPGNLNVSTTGTVTLINGVATGTDFTDRIGRKIVMRSVYVRGLLRPEDTTVSDQCARVMLVYDMQSNGAAPAITDILKSASSLAQLNMNNRDRFRVLMDKTFAMAGLQDTATQAFAGSPTTHVMKKYKRCNLEVLYNGTTNAIGSIATGALFLVTIGSVAAGSASTFTVSTRVRFDDA